MPAMKITIARPTPFQTSTRATDSTAICGSVSHFRPGDRPTRPIVEFMSPSVGCISSLNVMPTATVLTSTGKNTIDRRVPLSLMRDVTRTPSAVPRTTLSPLVTTA